MHPMVNAPALVIGEKFEQNFINKNLSIKILSNSVFELLWDILQIWWDMIHQNLKIFANQEIGIPLMLCCPWIDEKLLNGREMSKYYHKTVLIKTFSVSHTFNISHRNPIKHVFETYT